MTKVTVAALKYSRSEVTKTTTNHERYICAYIYIVKLFFGTSEVYILNDILTARWELYPAEIKNAECILRQCYVVDIDYPKVVKITGHQQGFTAGPLSVLLLLSPSLICPSPSHFFHLCI